MKAFLNPPIVRVLSLFILQPLWSAEFKTPGDKMFAAYFKAETDRPGFVEVSPDREKEFLAERHVSELAIQNQKVLDEVRQHSLAYPIEHGAQVPKPPNDQIEFFG